MENRGNRTAAILGMVLITIGVITLIGQFTGDNPMVGASLTLLLGLLFFAGAMLGGRSLSVMAIPGAVLTSISIFRFVQLLFPGLDSGLYLWPLVISAVGLGLVTFGRLSGSPDLVRGGWGVARSGLVLFIMLGIFIELFGIFTGLSGEERSQVWPIVLIAVGVITLLVRLVRLSPFSGLLGGARDTDVVEPTPTSDIQDPPSDAPRDARRAQRWERRSMRDARRAEHDTYDLFSPVLWIGFGILWLQLVLNQITLNQLLALAALWPVLLIFAGISVLFGRRQALVNLVLGVVLVAGSFYAVQNGERLGLTGRMPWMVMGINNENGRITERVNGSGTLVSETRPVSDFDAIVLTGGGEVTLVQGSPAGLVIESDDNLLPYLTSEVVEGKLRLGVKQGVGINPSRLRYTITASSLNSLTVNGAASVKASQLNGEHLDIHISGLGAIDLPDLQVDVLNIQVSGSGSVTAAGQAEQVNVQISGAGAFTGTSLRSQQANVQISGVGRANVWATDSLISSISGMGSVGYYGSPTVNKTTGGLGLVRHLGDK